MNICPSDKLKMKAKITTIFLSNVPLSALLENVGQYIIVYGGL